MKRSSVFSCLLSLAVGSGAFAGGFDWSFTSNNNGAGWTIVDNNITIAPILLDDPNAPGKSLPNIASMELELTGLSHTFPADLDIYLIDPMLHSIKIMTDRGGGTDLVDFTLIFNDGGVALPSGSNPLVNNTTYVTEGASAVPPVDGGFSDFVGQSGGTANWLLLIIDDAVNDGGSLDSFTLRGTVPEPATLSLLALGAIAALRRKVR